MPTDPDDALAFLAVSVQGVDFARQVVYAEVEDNDRLIDRAQVILEDQHGALGDLPREGQTLKLDLGWVSEHAVLFEGDIIRVITEAYGSSTRRLTLVALDPAYRLMQGAPKTRDHNGAVSSIVQSIVGEYSLPVGQIQLDTDPTITPEQPLRQTNKKDWAFIQDVANRYGARAFVEYNEGAAKFYMVSDARLVQGDATGELSYSGGPGQLIEFRYERVAASAAPVRTAITVDPTTGDEITAPAPTPTPPEPPPAADSIRADVLGELGTQGDDYTKALQEMGKATRTPDQQRPQTILSGLPSDPTLPDRATLTDPTRVLGLHGEGLAVGTVKLRAKGKVSIKGIVNWADGDWYVRQVRHIVAEQNYWTRFVVTK
ncbi:MAG: hypothetical protein HY741_05810 [Chloroflexi bacterium]|nr:hypothetical protein [Chloroflexota bacterium]